MGTRKSDIEGLAAMILLIRRVNQQAMANVETAGAQGGPAATVNVNPYDY